VRPDLCIHGLEVLRSQIKDRGPQPKRDLQTLDRIFGDEPIECAALVMHDLAHIAEDQPTDASEQEELKKSILETLEKEVARQKHRLELTRELDDIAFASDIQEPDAPTRETLLRYRAANTGNSRIWSMLLGFCGTQRDATGKVVLEYKRLSAVGG
jgi:hypothetical protein